jgi:hypothetical protein
MFEMLGPLIGVFLTIVVAIAVWRVFGFGRDSSRDSVAVDRVEDVRVGNRAVEPNKDLPNPAGAVMNGFPPSTGGDLHH